MKKRAVLFILMLVFLGACCTFLYFKYEDLSEDYIKLTEDYIKLTDEYSRISTEYSRISKEYDKLSEENRNLLNSYNTLKTEHYNLINSYTTLKEDYNTLQARYADISNRYSNLEGIYRELQLSYNNLNSTYRALKLQYDYLQDVAIRLNNSMAYIADMLEKYSILPNALERALNLKEVEAVEPYVKAAGVYTNDFWSSIQNIYIWICKNVKYVHDVPIPIPYYKTCYICTGLRYCYYYFTEHKNYVQTPRFTAEYGQGDCDDQAVLAYAMIKYYTMSFYRENYSIWYVLIEFNNGDGHAVVFLPVKGGLLTIVDPAGAYLTSIISGTITARPAYSELTSYSNYWQSSGGIKYLKVYEVDVYTGRYRLVVKGDISEVASYIASLG